MAMDTKHTPGPWAVNPVKAQIDEMHGLTPVCGMLWPTDIRSEAETEANARRIVAAVNAVEGIPTKALEAGVIHKMVAFVAQMMAQTNVPIGVYDADELRSLSETLGLCPICGDPERLLADDDTHTCELCERDVHQVCTREAVTLIEPQTSTHPGHVHTERVCDECARQFERGEA